MKDQYRRFRRGNHSVAGAEAAKEEAGLRPILRSAPAKLYSLPREPVTANTACLRARQATPWSDARKGVSSRPPPVTPNAA
jgi:hypothetical protein